MYFDVESPRVNEDTIALNFIGDNAELLVDLLDGYFYIVQYSIIRVFLIIVLLF